MLMLPLELVFLRLLVFELAEADDLTDRRFCLGNDLDEVCSTLKGEFDPLLGRHYAQLTAVLVDHADFGNFDFVVYSRSFRIAYG